MKILFVNANLKGHVHPTLSMAEVLIRRGHFVFYFSGEDFRATIEDLGATFVPFSDGLARFYSGYRPSDRHPFFLLTEFMLSWDEAMLPEVIALCRKEKFDMLVCDSVFGGAYFLRRILGVPVVVSHSTFPMLRAPVPDRMLEPGFHPQLDRSIAIMERISSAYGITPCGITEIFVSRGDLNLVYTGREFGGMPEPAEGEDDGYYFVGPSLLRNEKNLKAAPSGSENGAGILSFASESANGGDSRPLVLVSMGSIGIADPDFYRMCVEALRGTDFRGLLVLGDKVAPDALGELPGNVAVAEYIPQLAVLAHTDVFVTHAGFNSAHEAILSGVPMLAIPFANDQFLVARKIAEKGLGETMDRKSLTTDLLRDAITRLARDDEMRARCRKMAGKMLSGPTREDAAKAMERLVGAGCPETKEDIYGASK